MEVTNWFRETIPLAVEAWENREANASIARIVRDASQVRPYEKIPLSCFRHVFLSDLKSPTSRGTTTSMERYIPALYKTGPSSMTAWGSSQMTSLDPFPPTYLPEDSATTVGPNIRTPIDPYDRYYRKKLVQQYPHQTLPFVMPAVTSESAQTSAATMEDELTRLGLTMTDVQGRGIVAGGNVLSNFLQSLLPWTSAHSSIAGVDILDIPGMVGFLQGDLRQ